MGTSSSSMASKSNIITIPDGYTPRPYQEELFRYMDTKLADPNTHEAKALLVWPRQVGKDTSCFSYMVKQAARVSGNYFYIFPTREEAKRALWNKVMDDGRKLLEVLPKHAVKSILRQEMFIELNHDVLGVNSTIQIVGLDFNPDAIRGVTPQGVVFSEFAFSDFEVYKNLLAAMRRKGCWQIINSTPNGRNHFYRLYEGARKSDNWFVSHLQGLWPDRDNYLHIHDQKYFTDQIDEGMTTWEDLEREYGCSFSTGMKGAYYVDQIEQAYHTGRIGDYAYDDTAKVYTYWDLGVDDSTAVWFVQKIGNKIVFIDYLEESSKDLQYYVKALEMKGYQYGAHYLPHDANQRSIQTGNTTARMFEEILASNNVDGYVYINERLPVQHGINAVRSRFSRYHFDAARCDAGLKKLELYHRRYDKKRETFLQEPVHDYTSHAADALRMEAISEDIRNDGFYKVNKITVVSDFDLFE